MANFANIPKIRIFAVLAVALMAITPFIVPVENISAASGDGGTYSYTITYNSSQMSTTSAAISVAGMDPVYHPSLSGSTASGYGSWTWDRNTGLGPFNSYYAAFDQTNGNKFVAIMDPYNLKAGIDGTDYTSRMSTLNIMWVLPTVYWKSTSTTLTLSNDPSSGGVAYAHTIDGHVYNNIAIGVYEGSTETVGGQTVLSSQSGATPANTITRATFREYAHNWTMDTSLKGDSTYASHSMLWNFYQWQLYKYCAWTLMENFNSQTIVGNGHIYSSNYAVTTGATDSRGPYAGNPGNITDAASAAANGVDSVKLFIENAWGAEGEFVDGVVVRGNYGLWVDTKSTPDDTEVATDYVKYIGVTMPNSSGYASAIATDAATVWGVPSAVSGGSNSKGLADVTYIVTTGSHPLAVGGSAATSALAGLDYGVNFFSASDSMTVSKPSTSTRLAFVFDADLTGVTVSASSNNTDYGTVSPASVDVGFSSQVTVSGNVLTVDGKTITATATTSDAQYTYAFEGWYVGSSPLASGTYLYADTAVTARFSATLNDYDLTVASNNTAWGTVDVPSIADVPYGTVLTVSGTTMTVNGTTVTATPSEDTEEITYAFEGWYIGGTAIASTYTVTGDATITAQFSRTANLYTIQVVSNNIDWGTVSPEFVYDVPYGAVITTFNNTFRVNGSTVTATAAEPTDYDRFVFRSWSVLSGTTVTGDMTITATFERRGTDVTVTIVPNNPDYGSVSVGTFDYVPVGSVIDIVGSTLTIAGNVTTATAAESTLASQFDFAGFFIGAQPITPGAAITSNTVITAVFLETPHLYNVPIRVNDPAYGTVDIGRLENVPYGAVMTVSGTSITVNDTTVTATVADDNEQYRFSWAGWTYRGSTVVSGTTAVSGPSPIIATVDAVLQQYTVTWIIGETIETQTYSYGDWPTHDTPDAPEEGEVFYWWEPRVTHVTGDAEYTAVFGPPHEMPDYTPLVGIVITLLIMAIMFGIYKSGHDITGRDVALAMLALVILLLMIPYMAG